jgi:hypothetical protein
MTQVVKCPFDVGIQYPGIAAVSQPQETLFYSIVAASTWAKAVTMGFKTRFKARFQGIFDN